MKVSVSALRVLTKKPTRRVGGARNLRIEHKGHEGGVVTCSIGATALGSRRNLHDAYRAADECLYRIKQSGRDNLELVSIGA